MLNASSSKQSICEPSSSISGDKSGDMNFRPHNHQVLVYSVDFFRQQPGNTASCNYRKVLALVGYCMKVAITQRLISICVITLCVPGSAF